MAATGGKITVREGGDGLSGSGSKVRIFKQDPSVKTMGHRYSVLILHYSIRIESILLYLSTTKHHEAGM